MATDNLSKSLVFKGFRRGLAKQIGEETARFPPLSRTRVSVLKIAAPEPLRDA